MTRRRQIAVGAVAAVALGTAAAVAAPSRDHLSRPLRCRTAVQQPTPPSDRLLDAFAVLRRERTPDDGLPPAVATTLRRRGIAGYAPEATRLLRTTPAGGRAWVVPVPDVTPAVLPLWCAPHPMARGPHPAPRPARAAPAPTAGVPSVPRGPASPSATTPGVPPRTRLVPARPSAVPPPPYAVPPRTRIVPSRTRLVPARPHAVPPRTRRVPATPAPLLPPGAAHRSRRMAIRPLAAMLAPLPAMPPSKPREGVLVVATGDAAAGGGGATGDLLKGRALPDVEPCTPGRAGLVRVSGLVPDGVTAVFLTATDGSAVRTEPRDGGYVFEVAPLRTPRERYVVWTGTDGTPHVQPVVTSVPKRLRRCDRVRRPAWLVRLTPAWRPWTLVVPPRASRAGGSTATAPRATRP
jgi:hypothetical protein